MKKIIKNWLYAVRIHTLPLSISGIILGTCIAYSRGYYNKWIFLFSIITGLLLQILANFANDYGDAIKGVDNNKRLGPKRMVQNKYISFSLMKKVIIIFSILSFISSLVLIYISFIKDIINILFFIILSIICIYAAIKYTIGKNPYGYKGYGDIAVFIFFGLIPIQGIYFLYTHFLTFDIIILSISIGLLNVAVLNINNIRDIENDFNNYKYTIPIIIGIKKSFFYQKLLLLIPVILGIFFIIINYKGIYQFFFLLIIVPILYHIKKIKYISNYKEFNNELKNIILINIFYSFLLGIGQL